MTIFELARKVSAKDAAEQYGLRFDRSGRGFCPWHEDGRHAALQFFDDGGCYCHACHAHGDAVSITARMLGVPPREAAERLQGDFHLGQPTDNAPDPAIQARARQRRDRRERFSREWGFLCDVIHEADVELSRFSQETAWNSPRFRAVLVARTRAEDRLNMMWEAQRDGT